MELLVIGNQCVSAGLDQALHTPLVTLEIRLPFDGYSAHYRAVYAITGGCDLSEVGTRWV